MSLLACFRLGWLFSSRAATMPQTFNFCRLHPPFPRLLAVVSWPLFHPPIGQFAVVALPSGESANGMGPLGRVPCAPRSATVGTNHPSAAAQVWKKRSAILAYAAGVQAQP